MANKEKFQMNYQEIIHIGNQQVENQKAISLEIANSNLEGAQIISSEIINQTSALSNTITNFGKEIFSAILFSTDAICNSLDRLGDRLCTELSEIRWQLIQQLETQEKIFEVLYNNRNNEARQLVNQGIRLYVNNEIEEAEECFKRALNYDVTDYQVLMNLGFIERSKGCFSSALSYFDKALKRPQPEKMDSISKARALWAIANLYRKEKNFNKAYFYAKEAFSQDNQKDPKNIYSLGVYAALSGDKKGALDKIEQAIILDPTYFTRAAVEPDLGEIKNEVLELLSSLSTNIEFKTKLIIDVIKTKVSELEYSKSKFIKDIDENFLFGVHKHFGLAIENIRKSSYSNYLQSHANLCIIEKTLIKIKLLFDLHSQKISIQKDISYNKNKISELKKITNPKKSLNSFFILLLFTGYLIVSFFIANSVYPKAKLESGGNWLELFFVWPIYFIASILLGILKIFELILKIVISFMVGPNKTPNTGSNYSPLFSVFMFLTCIKFIFIVGISISIIKRFFKRIFWHKRILKFNKKQIEIKNLESQLENEMAELSNIEKKMYEGE